MAKYCSQQGRECRMDCAKYVFYGRKGELRLGMCVWVKIADLMELHFLEMI